MNLYLYLGHPGAPNNPLSIPINTSSIMLTWEPPPDVLMPSILYYIVTIRNGSGDILYNETLRVSQLIFNTPNSCGQYEASVTAMCGTAIGANVLFHMKGSKSTFFKFEF